MSKLISIGEALIDFMSNEEGNFVKSPGGAPANVAACVARLGGKSQLITKVGEDFFGGFLKDIMGKANIDCRSVYKTSDFNTGLAFVTHRKNGEREFLFYRQPSADMMLNENEIEEEWFEEEDILHFCSVDLVDAPVRRAHDRAIEIAKKKGCTICFDPNVRLALWEDHVEYKKIINRYIDVANILKVSNDELEFITGIKDEEKALNMLLKRVDMLIYTEGSKGATIKTEKYTVKENGIKVKAVDTTGAGDSFIGSFIYNLLENNISDISSISEEEAKNMLQFSNKVAAYVVSKKGSINIMPTIDEI